MKIHNLWISRPNPEYNHQGEHHVNDNLTGLLLACGDTEEEQAIPAPPAGTEAKPVEEAKPAEEAKLLKKLQLPKKPKQKVRTATKEGTKPEVKVSEKLITTGRVKRLKPNKSKVR